MATKRFPLKGADKIGSVLYWNDKLCVCLEMNLNLTFNPNERKKKTGKHIMGQCTSSQIWRPTEYCETFRECFVGILIIRITMIIIIQSLRIFPEFYKKKNMNICMSAELVINPFKHINGGLKDITLQKTVHLFEIKVLELP